MAEIVTEMVECPDCRGTCAEDPDCGCCEGKMEVTAAVAREWGHDPAEMEVLSDEHEEDVWYKCPVCDGYPCDWCESEDEPGKVPADRLPEEEIRVLRFALDGELPCGRHHLRHDGYLLSRAASARCREKGWTNWWFNMITGDEIYLTPSGKQAVMALYDDGTPQFLARSSNG